MNTKIVAVIIAVLLLLGAGGVFLYLQNSKPQSTTPANQAETKTENESAQNTLYDLLASGKTQSCTFSYAAEDGGSTKGTVYLSGSQMRTDVSVTASDKKESKISMIRDGDTTYVWGDQLTPGIKMTLSTDDLKTNTNANQYLNTTQKVDYKCGGWTLDPTKFSPPSNVKFTDMTSIMTPKTTGTTTQTQTTNGSDICAQITDPDSRAACENARQY